MGEGYKPKALDYQNLPQQERDKINDAATVMLGILEGARSYQGAKRYLSGDTFLVSFLDTDMMLEGLVYLIEREDPDAEPRGAENMAINAVLFLATTERKEMIPYLRSIGGNAEPRLSKASCTPALVAASQQALYKLSNGKEGLEHALDTYDMMSSA
ncbi:hypothetical protein JW968_06865 [Candidatus Woesearchaeota archaeon]|nr:hypothetical protein [Candidatus Woesearchaeota archaeon]